MVHHVFNSIQTPYSCHSLVASLLTKQGLQVNPEYFLKRGTLERVWCNDKYEKNKALLNSSERLISSTLTPVCRYELFISHLFFDLSAFSALLALWALVSTDFHLQTSRNCSTLHKCHPTHAVFINEKTTAKGMNKISLQMVFFVCCSAITIFAEKRSTHKKNPIKSAFLWY